MSRDLDTMTQIVNQKEKDIEASELQPMNPEGRYMAEHKRFTFDVVDVPTDPLR
jgi:hypothetical protein